MYSISRTCGGMQKQNKLENAIDSVHSSNHAYYSNCELLTQANSILASWCFRCLLFFTDSICCTLFLIHFSLRFGSYWVLICTYWSFLCPEYIKWHFGGLHIYTDNISYRMNSHFLGLNFFSQTNRQPRLVIKLCCSLRLFLKFLAETLHCK